MQRAVSQHSRKATHCQYVVSVMAGFPFVVFSLIENTVSPKVVRTIETFIIPLSHVIKCAKPFFSCFPNLKMLSLSPFASVCRDSAECPCLMSSVYCSMRLTLNTFHWASPVVTAFSGDLELTVFECFPLRPGVCTFVSASLKGAILSHQLWKRGSRCTSYGYKNDEVGALGRKDVCHA